MVTIFVLHKEISDQYGTSEAIAAFTSKEVAEAYGDKVILTRRTFVVELPLDPPLTGTRIETR